MLSRQKFLGLLYYRLEHTRYDKYLDLIPEPSRGPDYSKVYTPNSLKTSFECLEDRSYYKQVFKDMTNMYNFNLDHEGDEASLWNLLSGYTFEIFKGWNDMSVNEGVDAVNERISFTQMCDMNVDILRKACEDEVGKGLLISFEDMCRRYMSYITTNTEHMTLSPVGFPPYPKIYNSSEVYITAGLNPGEKILPGRLDGVQLDMYTDPIYKDKIEDQEDVEKDFSERYL